MEQDLSEITPLSTKAREARLNIRSTKAASFKALKDDMRGEWADK
jgi:hypothetical protein